MAGPGGTINLTDADDDFPQTGSSDDNSGAEFIFALRGSDTVLAGLQNDTVFGGDGDDELFGEDGNDLLSGDDGNDRIEGGAGNDNIQDLQGAFGFIDAGDDDDFVYIGGGFQTGSVVNGGNGHDVLSIGSATALNLIKVSGFEELSYGSGVGEAITGTARQFRGFSAITWGVGEVEPGYAALTLFGVPDLSYKLNLSSALSDLAVLFVGSLGHDRLTTGGGNDTVFGDLGNDSIAGGDGRDDLHGSAGNDTLAGGGGRDTLTGGGDDDSYVYRRVGDSRGNGDTVIGWENGNDRFDLSGIDAIAGGADDAFAFVGTGTITGVGGEIGFVNTATQTVVQVYLDGDTVIDMQIVIDGVFTLTGADFLG